MMKWEVLKWVEDQLASISESSAFEAREIVTAALDCSWIDLVMNRNEALSPETIGRIEGMVQRRKMREPLQHILGVQNFCGENFTVNGNVLIPRPETEILVMRILSDYKEHFSLRVLDLGTGSGIIAITLAKRMKAWHVTGSDISNEAIEVAKRNANAICKENVIKWQQSDVFEAFSAETFDIIVSNPPYIPVVDAGTLWPEVFSYEPHTALFGGDDGFDFYRRIIPEALHYLKKSGVLYLEAGHNQTAVLKEWMLNSGYKSVEIFGDLCHVQRFIKGTKEV